MYWATACDVIKLMKLDYWQLKFESTKKDKKMVKNKVNLLIIQKIVGKYIFSCEKVEENRAYVNKVISISQASEDKLLLQTEVTQKSTYNVFI